MKKVLPLLLLLFFVVGNAFSQSFNWVKQAGANLIDQGNAIAVDAAGNSYVTGSFTGTIDFAGPTKASSVSLTSAGSSDIFVAKYNPSGGFLWAKQAKGLGNDWGNAISVDGAGNAYVTGIVGGRTVEFSPTQSISSNQDDIFIAKYNASGVLQWVLQCGGQSLDYGHGIAALPSGTFYVTGVFESTATFNTKNGLPVTLTSNGIGDIFVAKYDAGGVLQWVKGSGGADPDYGDSIGVDAQQNAYVTGIFGSSFTWGPSTLIGVSDGFVTKYDPTGNVLWVRTMGGPIAEGGRGISVDSSGGPYVIGYYHNSLQFSGTALSLSSAGTNNKIFIARYDTNGFLLWAQSAGGTGNDSAGGISVRGANGPYVTGAFLGTASFGNQSVTSVGTADVFVAHYDQCGQLLWVRQAGGARGDFGNGISVDGAGRAYVTGTYQSNPAIFPGAGGGLTNSSTTTYNIFVARIK